MENNNESAGQKLEERLEKLFSVIEHLTAKATEANKSVEALENRIIRQEAEISEMGQANVKLRQELEKYKKKAEETAHHTMDRVREDEMIGKIDSLLKKIDNAQSSSTSA